VCLLTVWRVGTITSLKESLLFVNLVVGMLLLCLCFLGWGPTSTSQSMDKWVYFFDEGESSFASNTSRSHSNNKEEGIVFLL